jgi:type III secretory pathway component EscU
LRERTPPSLFTILHLTSKETFEELIAKSSFSDKLRAGIFTGVLMRVVMVVVVVVMLVGVVMVVVVVVVVVMRLTVPVNSIVFDSVSIDFVFDSVSFEDFKISFLYTSYHFSK